MKTRITELLGIQYPIIQGGMAWVAEHHLAAAVSAAGGLGLIGGANAPGEVVREEIRKARELTDKPIGVNVMLLSPHADDVASSWKGNCGYPAGGLDGFLEVENRANATLDVEKSVIAPGGSVIYGKEAMEHLKEIGLVVYLKLSYEDLKVRLGNLVDRGVVLKEGMTLLDLYNERVPYYEKYADITIDEEGRNAGMVVDELRRLIEERLGR